MENKIQDITEVELSEKEPSDAAHIYVEEDGKFRRHSFEAMKNAVQPDVEKEARQYADKAAKSAATALEAESNASSSASAAATSEENASNAELNASKYAADALAAQTAAANSATAADESATEADTSKTAAAGSAETAEAAATQAAIYKDEAFSVTPEGYEAVATYATHGLIIDDNGYFYALVEGEEE